MGLWGLSRYKAYQVGALGLCGTSQKLEMSGLSMANCMQQLFIEMLLYARQSLPGKRIHGWTRQLTINRRNKSLTCQVMTQAGKGSQTGDRKKVWMEPS